MGGGRHCRCGQLRSEQYAVTSPNIESEQQHLQRSAQVLRDELARIEASIRASTHSSESSKSEKTLDGAK
jgi:hypothetical protein